jgi:glycosyltransferase involved in cell wall biosynthesis
LNDAVPFISVIIPVYNDTERLRTCLAALAEQTLAADRFEVIVVDNGSSEPPRSAVESFAFGRFAEEAKPGSYAARNRGLELARGEVLAFTDSDCIPDRNWLDAAVGALEANPACGFVGGRVDVRPAAPANPTSVELYDVVFGLRQELNINRYHHAATANMITRRQMMERCGRFDEAVMSGGDLEWGQRVTAAGFPGVYCDAACVGHPARRQLSQLVRQARRHAGGRFDRHRARNPYKLTSLQFWRSVWKRLFPNLADIRVARSRLAALGYGTRDWLRVSTIVLCVQYAAAFEFIRRWLGFGPERR